MYLHLYIHTYVYIDHGQVYKDVSLPSSRKREFEETGAVYYVISTYIRLCVHVDYYCVCTYGTTQIKVDILCHTAKHVL